MQATCECCKKLITDRDFEQCYSCCEIYCINCVANMEPTYHCDFCLKLYTVEQLERCCSCCEIFCLHCVEKPCTITQVTYDGDDITYYCSPACLYADVV